MLSLQGVGKVYKGGGREVTALKNISIEVPGGVMAVLQGPSGCGKTTLLLAAGGLMAPDNGRVILEGEDLYALSPEERAVRRAKRVGFVFSAVSSYPVFDGSGECAGTAVGGRQQEWRGIRRGAACALRAGRAHKAPAGRVEYWRTAAHRSGARYDESPGVAYS